jgi:hypothetical protein
MAGTPDRIDGWQGLSLGWMIAAEQLAALAVWGGFGYLIDRLVWGVPRVFTPIGMLVGFALGMYLIYLRFIKERDESHD